jgi:hypothetical protein
MKPEDFAGKEPKLVLEEYFAGHTKAHGIFEDRFGTLRRQFVVDINGTWDGETLVLEEDFVYSDGETDRRVWTLRKQDDNTYIGTANDVLTPTTMKVFGNAMNFRYNVDLKTSDGTLNVRFNDWMFLQPDGVMINRARVSKWGIALGEATITFSKPAQSNQETAELEVSRTAAE